MKLRSALPDVALSSDVSILRLPHHAYTGVKPHVIVALPCGLVLGTALTLPWGVVAEGTLNLEECFAGDDYHGSHRTPLSDGSH